MTILSVTADKPPVVRCKTDLDEIVALWRGDVPPQVGLGWDVEVDTVGELVWANGPAIIDSQGRGEHGQVLSGVVEDIEGDAVAVRLGSALVLLEVRGEPPVGIVGSSVVVRPSAFQVWPIGV